MIMMKIIKDKCFGRQLLGSFDLTQAQRERVPVLGLFHDRQLWLVVRYEGNCFRAAVPSKMMQNGSSWSRSMSLVGPWSLQSFGVMLFVNLCHWFVGIIVKGIISVSMVGQKLQSVSPYDRHSSSFSCALPPNGGFLSHGGTPSYHSSIYVWDFPL